MKRRGVVPTAGAAAVCCLAASLVWSQQPAPPRPPTLPLSAEELGAIPLVPPRTGKSVTKKLFDGETLTGWRGNLDWWSVNGGAIVGKFHDKVPTSFLFTKENYSDFRLLLSSKMVESDNHAGVCFWGEIAEQGANKWYTHGPLVVFPNPSMWDYNAGKGLRVFKPTTEKVTSQHEWVKVEVLAQGNRVRAAFNGVAVLEWREPDPNRIKEGPIGIQLHAWTSAQEVLYRDIVIETFPQEDRLITVSKP
jgi:hypothetical protein